EQILDVLVVGRQEGLGRIVVDVVDPVHGGDPVGQIDHRRTGADPAVERGGSLRLADVVGAAGGGERAEDETAVGVFAQFAGQRDGGLAALGEAEDVDLGRDGEAALLGEGAGGAQQVERGARLGGR